LKIYDIEYSFDKKIEYEKPEGMLDGELGEIEDEWEYIDAHMQIGGEDFHEAVFEATDMLDQALGEGEYTILAVQEVAGVDILNWPGENEPCSCPQCRADRMADEDVMHFNCPKCNHAIKAAPGDWEGLNCPNCGEEILHDNIIDLGKNKYKVIKIKEKKEE
jgi:predicted RNA-binding Zn-ribbon protein involved in translation (DUF1610 family)